MKRFFSWQIVAILVLSLFFAFYNAPGEIQTKIFPWTPDSLAKQHVHLGLDLKGGSQLDYKIDLRKVEQKDQKQIIAGVMEVIEKRVNALGVSEPSIYLSKVGSEDHIIVELAEVKDLEEAKKAVGKTIQLEFKEKKEKADPEEEKKQMDYANSVLRKTLDGQGKNFTVVGQEEQQANPGKVRYDISEEKFVDDLSGEIKTAAQNLSAGQVSPKLITVSNEYQMGTSGQLEKVSGVYLVKLDDKKEEVRYEKELDASHILIAYAGAEKAATEVKRTESQAEKLAQDILAKAKKGEDFAKLAQENSDDPGSKTKGGVLDSPINKNAGYVTEFKEGALKLEKAGDISDVIKTQFGFHIIKANAVRKDVKQTKVKLEKIFISTMPDPWQETGLTGEHFSNAEVKFDQQFFRPYVAIQFNAEGAKLFEQITEKNIGKQVAIFVGGTLISSPVVEAKIPGGSAVINGNFSAEEAQNLAQNLNTGAIPAPILLVGQHTIGSTLGQEALDKSLKAGFIGLLLVAIFMIGWYRIPGLIATIALIVYTLTMMFLIKSELPIGLSLAISTAIFLVILYKILNNDDGRGEKFLSFLLSLIILFFLTSVLSSPITLTLAGIAGVVLSIGMEVDANILIFERMKEEIQNGHNLVSAVENGFNRAWNSIRDSNFSSLITCAILFYFGSSIIRGFALNLAVGIVVSMFTAITVSRTLLRAVMKTKLAEKPSLFAHVKKGEKKTYKFVEKMKLWYSVSGTLLAISLIALVVFGVKPGMDFTGGTFMEIKFKDPKITIEDVKKDFAAFEEKNTTKENPLDLKTAQIITTDEQTMQVKMKFISTETHDKLIKALEEGRGKLEETRFETIGATIGSDTEQKAIFAIIFASLMIMAYLAFAFRKIPKSVNPWRFGACAIIALIHDLFITFGVFLILGKFAGVEIDALFVTALLTVLGFSVHDTIVVFDRVREHLRKDEGKSLEVVVNESLTETMSRSINTSLSTVLTLIALLLFGSGTIFYFVLALTVGIIVGTYSSIFVASMVLVKWTQWARKRA
jgi:SecD/SecF fusion protein